MPACSQPSFILALRCALHMCSMYSTLQYSWPCSCSLWGMPLLGMSLLGYPIHKHSWALVEHRLPPSHDPTASSRIQRDSPSLMLVLVLLLLLMLMLNADLLHQQLEIAQWSRGPCAPCAPCAILAAGGVGLVLNRAMQLRTPMRRLLPSKSPPSAQSPPTS